MGTFPNVRVEPANEMSTGARQRSLTPVGVELEVQMVLGKEKRMRRDLKALAGKLEQERDRLGGQTAISAQKLRGIRSLLSQAAGLLPSCNDIREQIRTGHADESTKASTLEYLEKEHGMLEQQIANLSAWADQLTDNEEAARSGTAAPAAAGDSAAGGSVRGDPAGTDDDHRTQANTQRSTTSRGSRRSRSSTSSRASYERLQAVAQLKLVLGCSG